MFNCTDSHQNYYTRVITENTDITDTTENTGSKQISNTDIKI